jgi:hypothetical protein
MNTGSALIIEIVGPAGSTSVGVFSRTNVPPAEVDEALWPEELLDWAFAGGGAIAAARLSSKTKGSASFCGWRNVMDEPCIKV